MQGKTETNYKFPKGWTGMGFGKPWDAFGTYGLIPFNLLPVVDAHKFRGEFQWLPETYQTRWDSFSMNEDRGINLKAIYNQAEKLGIKLPYDFTEFMETPGIHSNLISVTDCRFELGANIVKTPGKNPQYFIRFMEDGQSVMHWYLHIDNNGKSYVACCNYDLESEFPKSTSFEKKLERVVICAPSFEEFLYRFWIETRIWIADSYNFDLTPEEEQYKNLAIDNINFYKKNATVYSSFKKLFKNFNALIQPECRTYLTNKLIRLAETNKAYNLDAGKKIIDDLNRSLFNLSYQKQDEITIHSNFGVALFTLRKLSETSERKNRDI